MSGILHMITGLGTGGAETMLAQLAAGLQAQGTPQHVVCLKDRGPVADRLESDGIPVTCLGMASLTEAPWYVLQLARLVRELTPRIVQGWMYHGNLAASLAHQCAAGRTARRLFWNIRASNMDAERYAHIIRWSARLSRWPDLIIANSKAGMEFHLGSGFRPKRSLVIPNGIDTAKFRPDPAARKALRQEWGIADEEVVALQVARVDPMKDHATFLEALEGLPHVRGVLAGLKTDKLDLPPNVHALGLRHDVAQLCAAADIIVSSSAYGEGFSNAIAEGMSAGLVPVATRVGDSAVIVEDAGIAVEPRDPAALRSAIAEVAALPAQQRRQKGLAARARIESNFSLDRAVQRFAEIYDEREATASLRVARPTGHGGGG